MNSKLPEFLSNMLKEQYKESEVKNIINGYKIRRKTTFRVNTLKSNIEEIANILNQNKMEYKKVKWSKEAFILENVSERQIKELAIYNEGKIYLQSLSSMLPPIILEPKEGMDLLDMTAAPGGKTTQIAAITNNKTNITAFEKNKIRAERLKYNIEKQGAKAYIMIQDATKISDLFSFDQILLDAPCSGSGTIDLQDCKLKEIFTLKLIQKSIQTQRELFSKAINLLKKGKEMVYSTCSVLACENEEIIQKFLTEKKIEIIPINFKGIEELPRLSTKIPGTLCIYPNEYYEGFFVAKIKKINN